MALDGLVLQLGAIIVGAALLGTLFLYTRQPIILAYIAIGMLAGPHGLSLISDHQLIAQLAELGVMLLLFILGLHMQPAKLWLLFRRVALLTSLSSLLFCLVIVLLMIPWFSWQHSLLIGLSLMLSSTVIALKLIPTTTLHHRHAGEVMTSILLLQDILAILVILYVSSSAATAQPLVSILFIISHVGLLSLVAGAAVKWAILPLLRRFDVIEEYTFLITLAWCLLVAGAAQWLGISHEIGAFIAGVTLAYSRIAQAIAEQLKSLREFFLILFFFAVGARFDLSMSWALLLGSIALGGGLVLFKCGVYRLLLLQVGESTSCAKEISIRLAQASEFSLLLSYAAYQHDKISHSAAMLIQSTTLVTFVFSTLWVVRSLRTPISPRQNSE